MGGVLPIDHISCIPLASQYQEVLTEVEAERFLRNMLINENQGYENCPARGEMQSVLSTRLDEVGERSVPQGRSSGNLDRELLFKRADFGIDVRVRASSG